MTKLSKDEMSREYTSAMEWLDTFDPTSTELEEPADLRRIGRAAQDLDLAEADLRAAVHSARVAGRSWAMIGLTLGVSKQAAQQRFGQTTALNSR